MLIFCLMKSLWKCKGEISLFYLVWALGYVWGETQKSVNKGGDD